MRHRQRTNPARSRVGMTLLELLLALAVMASVMALLGALMGQARGWTERSAQDESLMHLQRVGEAMRSQWADRRTPVDLKDSGDKVVATSTNLQFVTATGLLFPDWPLVKATYRIEPDTSHVSSSGLLWRLVYEETRIAGMDKPPEDDGIDADGRSMRDTIVLLDACPELRWERFGRAKAAEDADANADEQDDDGTSAGTGAAPKSGSASTGRATKRPGQQRERGQNAPSDEDKKDAMSKDEDQEFLWRPIEEEYTGFLPAARLVGTTKDGERLGWVFVIRALR